MPRLQRYFLFSSPLPAIGSLELDPIKNPSYNLVVSVKDMGGQNENSFSVSTSVDITVKENIWKAPEPLEIVENSTDPHPIKVTQVVPKKCLEPSMQWPHFVGTHPHGLH